MNTEQPLPCRYSEAMANTIADILPDINKINRLIDSKLLTFDISIANWERPIIIERAWFIYGEKNHVAKC